MGFLEGFFRGWKSVAEIEECINHARLMSQFRQIEEGLDRISQMQQRQQDSDNEAMVRMNDSNNNAAVRINADDNLASTAVVGIAAAAGAYGIKKLCESDNSGKALNDNSDTPRLKSGKPDMAPWMLKDGQ